MVIQSEADLAEANLRMAFSLAHTMTSDQYDQLCRVTVQHWRREGERSARARAEYEPGVCR